MLLVGLEPTIPLSERAKTVHVVDLAAAVIGDSIKVTGENKVRTTFPQITKHSALRR
jgi:hypothetical protein